MKKISAIVLMTLILFSGLPLQKENYKLALPKLPKHYIECSWLNRTPKRAKLERATYSRCYAMNGATRLRQQTETNRRQALQEPVRPAKAAQKPSVNFTLGGGTERLLADNGAETPAPADEGAYMAEAFDGAGNPALEETALPDGLEIATVEGMDCPRARFEGETDELKVFAAADEGVFPYGTEMRVEPVPSDYAVAAVNGSGKSATDALAADITFWHNGEEVQPQGEVFVQLTAKREIAGDSHHSVTIDDDGNATLIASAASAASIFNTNHFTVYGIVGAEYTDDEDINHYIRHKYIFYTGDPSADESTWHAVAEQLYRDGDTIAVPADPKGDSKHAFAGWEIKSVDGTALAESEWKKITNGDHVTIDPATMSAEDSENADPDPVEVKVYATYDSLYQVTFYTKDEADLETATVYVAYVVTYGNSVTLPGKEEMNASGIFDDGEGFAGWKRAGAGDDEIIVETTVEVTEDMDFVPVTKGIHTVKFEHNPEGMPLVPDATIPDQKVVDGESAEEPAARKAGQEYDGYLLEGWYKTFEDDGTGNYTYKDQWNFTTNAVTEDGITLYAKWEPKTAPFTVEIWRESQTQAGVFESYTVSSATDAQNFGFSGTPGTQFDSTLFDKIRIYVESKHEELDRFHLSKTGITDDADDPYAFEIVNDGTVVAQYDANNGSYVSGANDAVIKGDGSTVVRVYESRDTYHVYFLFRDGGSGATTVHGYTGYTTVNQNYQQYLADIGLPVTNTLAGVEFDIRYRDNLYSVVYNNNETIRKLMRNGWIFESDYFRREGGQATFHEENMTYNFRAVDDARDGENLICRIYWSGNSGIGNLTDHTFMHVYLDPNGNEITEETVERIIAYANLPHVHTFHIGIIESGYQLYSIFNGVDTYELGNNEGSGSYSFTYANGEPNPMVVTYKPLPYHITFEPQDGTDTFRANNGVWTAADDQTAFYIGDSFEHVVTDENGAGTARYQAGYTEVQNGILKRFDGWYLNAKCLGEHYNFTGKTMGTGDITFYGKWTPVECRVVYHDNYSPGNDVIGEKDVVIGHRAARIENPTRTGYVFSGWYYRDGNGGEQLFSQDAVLTKEKVNELANTTNAAEGTAEIHLYANWTLPGPYSIRYDANGGALAANLQGQLDADSKDKHKYYGGALAPTLGVAEKDGEIFIGWKIRTTGDDGAILKDGHTFKADDSMVSEWDEDASGNQLNTGTIVLVAQYDKKVPTTSVTYHSHYPDGTPDKDVVVEADRYLAINGDYTIHNVTHEELAFSPNDRSWEFLYWTTEEDGGGEKFYPEEIVAIGQEDNDLYAQWIRIQIDTLNVVKVWNDNNNPARPASVTVRLYADGNPAVDYDGDAVPALTLNAENSWSGSWSKLPEKNASGNKIDYTVEEEAVGGYTVHYTSATREGILTFTVTNTHTPTPPTPDPDPEPPTPPTPDPHGHNFICGTPVDSDQLSPCPDAECPATVTDAGNTYTAAKIDGYCWMTENLRTPAPNAMIYRSTLSNNLQINFQNYGYLYTWHDAAGGTDTPERVNGHVRGICPEGWHLPTTAEINVLRTRSAEEHASTDHWVFHFGTNASGFNARPAGFYNATLDRFEALHSETWFHGDTSSSAFGLQYHCCTVPFDKQSQQNAFSVRCVKDCE